MFCRPKNVYSDKLGYIYNQRHINFMKRIHQVFFSSSVLYE